MAVLTSTAEVGGSSIYRMEMLQIPEINFASAGGNYQRASSPVHSGPGRKGVGTAPREHPQCNGVTRAVKSWKNSTPLPLYPVSITRGASDVGIERGNLAGAQCFLPQ